MSDDRTPGVDRPADLEVEFRALAEEVEAAGRVPDFRSMMERVHAEVDGEASPSAPTDADASPDVIPLRTSEDARRDFARLGRWIPVAAAAALAGLLLFGGGDPDGDAEFDRLVADYAASAAGWRSPTASLMEIPGVDLGSVPSIGGAFPNIDLPETNSDEGRDS